MASSSSISNSKQLYILRHGQATHNPRAEAARENGCSQDEFMELMRQDDSLDSPLTELGQIQAKSVYDQSLKQIQENIQLVVSSSLSRAIQTANLAAPLVDNRVCVEDCREVLGKLLNGKRRKRSELQQLFPNWNFDSLLTEEDELWTPELESQSDCSARGYKGLCWIMGRPEDTVLLVCHGGLLRFTMNMNDAVKIVDGRTSTKDREDVKARFGNCELRRYAIQWEDQSATESTDVAKRTVVLTELDLP